MMHIIKMQSLLIPCDAIIQPTIPQIRNNSTWYMYGSALPLIGLVCNVILFLYSWNSHHIYICNVADKGNCMGLILLPIAID